MVLGNKADLENKRKVSQLEGKTWAKERDYQFSETSAKTNENGCVDKAFQILIGKITEKVILSEREAFQDDIKREREGTIKFEINQTQNKTCC